MPFHLLSSIGSMSRRGALSALVIISMAVTFGGLADARQADPTPTPEVADLPAGVEVVLGAALDLEAGDYQWHVSEMTSSMPGDAPMPVHRGVLFAASGPVLVSHDGATLDQVAEGQALLLAEGESILPLSMTTTPVALVLVELVSILAPATPEPAATPGIQEPMVVAQGSYVIALLHLPPSGQNDAAIETIAAGAAVPIAEVAIGSETATPEITNRERWIVALFAPGEVEDTTGPDAGSDDSAPMGTSTATATSSITTVTPTTTATTTPTPATTATITPTPTAATTIEPTLPPITFDTPTPTPGGFGSSSDTFDPGNDAPSLATDTDGDGLVDVLEADEGSNPNNKDSDGDGLQDGPEVDNGCSPLKPDTDDDGVPDDGEVLLYKTDCDDVDTDDDSLFDYDEIFVHFSDPRLRDTDGDGLSDYFEVITFDTGVRVPDSDGDGWNDGYEVYTTGTNPALVDSDYDCLSDGYESSIGTNPSAKDSDGDGSPDGLELSLGIDPLNPAEYNDADNSGYRCDGTTVSR